MAPEAAEDDDGEEGKSSMEGGKGVDKGTRVTNEGRFRHRRFYEEEVEVWG